VSADVDGAPKSVDAAESNALRGGPLGSARIARFTLFELFEERARIDVHVAQRRSKEIPRRDQLFAP
jgi:hypothetical protein